MLQIILTLAIFLILVIPMGKYMYHIATKQKTFADKIDVYKRQNISLCIVTGSAYKQNVWSGFIR